MAYHRFFIRAVLYIRGLAEKQLLIETIPMRVISVIISITLISLMSCGPKAPKLVPLDLLSEGLPLKINAPADVEIVATDLGIMKDVTVKNGESYNIQIIETEANSLDAAVRIDAIKEEIKASEFFAEIIKEEADGFIYKKVIDENYVNFDFRHVKIRGDKQYVIQAGLSTQYTEDEIEIMYNSVK